MDVRVQPRRGPLTLFAFLLTLALLTAGCSRGPQDTSARDTSTATASPDAAGDETEPDAAGDDAPGDGSDPSSENNSGAADDTDGTPGAQGEVAPTPEPSPPPGMIYPPRRQRYVYTVAGERRTPSMTAAAAYPTDARLEWTFEEVIPIPGKGLEFVYTGSLEADEASFEDRIWFMREGLRRAYNSTRLPGGVSYSCRYAPPIGYADFPVQESTYPTQRWAGSGCSGTTDITVEGMEDMQDGQGRSWQTWKIVERMTYRMQSANGSMTLVRWISTDLGVDVRTERTDQGIIRTSGVGTPRPYTYDQVLVLSEMSEN